MASIVAQPVRLETSQFRVYKDAMTSSAEVVAVEHASLPRTRLPEAMLVTCLFKLTNPRNNFSAVGYVSPAVSRDRFHIESVIRDIFGKTTKAYSSGGCTAYSINDSLFWFIDASSVNVRDLPFGTLDFACMVDSQLISQELADVIRRVAGRVLFCGAPSPAGTWWYDFSRGSETTLFRYPLSAVVESWPDQSVFALAADEPDYKRLMLCEDDETHGRLVPFGAFAKRRLKVRTDKQATFLTLAQQKEAAAQFGTPVVTFELSDLQRRYMAMKRMATMRGRKPWYLLLKYRRGGFTTIEQGLNYAEVVQRPRSYVACLADTREKAVRIFRMAKTFHENDPRAPHLVGDSKTALEFANGSFYFIGTAGASGFARGDTLQRVHGSEVAKWCNGDQEKVEEVLAGIKGAAEHGSIILESTPNGIEWFAHTYRAAKRGENDFTPIFVRWFDDPGNKLVVEDPSLILDTLTDEESRMMDVHKLSVEQISFRRDRKRAFGRLFPQEYPEDDETCFIVSGTPFFDYEQILMLMSKIDAPQLKDDGSGIYAPAGAKRIPGGYEMRWEEPLPGVKYVMGVDTSEGLSTSDPNGIGVMRKDNGAQVASLHGKFTPRVLAEHVCRVSMDYNRALIGIERQNHGHAVIQKVIDLGIMRSHFEGGQLFYHGRSRTKVRRDLVEKAGWSTDVISRPVMLDHLEEWVSGPEAVDRVKDREFLSECLTFRLQSSGKFEADAGCHDDSVMKWAIANEMRLVHVSTGRFIG